MILMSSCGVQKQQKNLYDPNEVAQVSRKLGIPLSNMNKEDDKHMTLYAEASLWIGVPYRYGGISRDGIDCSGLTVNIFSKIYRKRLPRNSAEMAQRAVHKISKGSLKPGDLIFFATNKKSGQINHVGIYLKDGFFLHSSTSKGVIVSNIRESYYEKVWKMCGRPK